MMPGKEGKKSEDFNSKILKSGVLWLDLCKMEEMIILQSMDELENPSLEIHTTG